MAWSPNSRRTPRQNRWGRSSRGAYHVLIQLCALVPQRVPSGPVRSGVKPASAVRPSAITRSITATTSSGGKVSACSTHTTGVAAAVDARVDLDGAAPLGR